MHIHSALSDAQRCFDRFAQTRTVIGIEAQTILDHLQNDALFRLGGFLAALLRIRCDRYSRHVPREHARVALLFQQREHFRLGEVVRHGHRKGHEQTRIAIVQPMAHGIAHGLRRIALHELTALTAMQMRRTRKQQLQMIVQLRHRAHGRAGSPHGIGLIDGDGRRNPFDPIDLRLVHAIQKLSRIRRERFDVASLTFRIERVEDERGFSRARHTGHDDQLVRGQLHVEILEIVLARAVDDDGMRH